MDMLDQMEETGAELETRMQEKKRRLRADAAHRADFEEPREVAKILTFEEALSALSAEIGGKLIVEVGKNEHAAFYSNKPHVSTTYVFSRVKDAAIKTGSRLYTWRIRGKTGMCTLEAMFPPDCKCVYCIISPPPFEADKEPQQKNKRKHQHVQVQ